jgi:hypothetical protein
MRIWRKLQVMGATAALALASSVAYGGLEFPLPPPAVSVTANPASLVMPGPGAKASVTLTFEFLADYAFNSISLFVNYEKQFLTFNRGDSTVGVLGAGSTVPLANAAALLTSGLPGSDVENDNPSVGEYSLSGYTIATSYPLLAGTKLVLTGVFDLSSSFAATTTTNVDMAVYVAGPSADLGQEDAFPGLRTTVSAVPEPETWMLLLGGLGLIASRVRRASKARTDSEAASA